GGRVRVGRPSAQRPHLPALGIRFQRSPRVASFAQAGAPRDWRGGHSASICPPSKVPSTKQPENASWNQAVRLVSLDSRTRAKPACYKISLTLQGPSHFLFRQNTEHQCQLPM